MPRIDGILETSLYVADPVRSAAFYRDVFGFEAVVTSERLIAVAAGPRQLLLLFKKGAPTDMPETLHEGAGSLHLAFAIPLAELAAWEAKLAECGVAVIHRRVWELGGTSLYFRDPDGHLLEVATPGVWPVY